MPQDPGSRREFLRRVAEACAGLSLAGIGRIASPSWHAEAAACEQSLNTLAVAKGLRYGAAAQKAILARDPEFGTAFQCECGILVPELELKFAWLRPTPDQFEFTAADWLEAFARAHGQLFRGHTLIWYKALPDWFSGTVDATNGRSFLTDHVHTVVSHYRGRVQSWDVVNEAINPADGRPDALRKSRWLKAVGPEYIDLAFHTAADADPSAMLVYNETYLDYDDDRDNGQREAVLRLLQDFRTRGVPVHALGVQAHLRGVETTFSARKLREFLAAVAAMGYRIIISELDVRDTELPADVTTRDNAVAAAYRDYLDAALDERAVIDVLTWGLSDKYSWLSSSRPRGDGLPLRPLPLDANLQPTPAYRAIASAFRGAPPR